MVGYALSGAAFILVVNALVGENGYLATLRAQRESAAIEAELQQVREENQQMRDRISGSTPIPPKSKIPPAKNCA